MSSMACAEGLSIVKIRFTTFLVLPKEEKARIDKINLNGLKIIRNDIHSKKYKEFPTTNWNGHTMYPRDACP